MLQRGASTTTRLSQWIHICIHIHCNQIVPIRKCARGGVQFVIHFSTTDRLTQVMMTPAAAVINHHCSLTEYQTWLNICRKCTWTRVLYNVALPCQAHASANKHTHPTGM
jgi:hypothetical protein